MLGKAPLWEALQKHLEGHYYPLHVPGHKQGRGLPLEFTERLIELDLTELPGLDNLLDPTGVLQEAEALASNLAGSMACHFTTNGSSAGVIAAMLGVCSPGDAVLLPRNAHLACLNACVIGDLRPIFADVKIDPDVNVVLGVDIAHLSRQLERHSQVGIKAVLVVNPSYHGICNDLSLISNVCSERDAPLPLIVDEAHGTHFLLGSPLPPSGLHNAAAAVVVQSVHKTGLGMTGTAWVHVNRPELMDRVKRSLRLMQSTSPSYVLLASMDLCRSIMAGRGNLLLAQALEVASQVRDMFPTYEPPEPWHYDPLKIILDARPYGISGYQLEEQLRLGGIALEIADQHTATLVISLADGEESVQAARRASQLLETTCKRHDSTVSLNNIILPPLGEQLVTPRNAHFAPAVWRDLKQTCGSVAGDPITPYPPGIPLVWPGQRIEAEVIEYLLRATALGATVTGVSQGQVRVLK